MDKKKSVDMPIGFRQWFDYVTAYYRCPRDEVKLMVRLVRENPDSAAMTFLALYKMLLGPAFGFNERLKREIEVEKQKRQEVENK